ncbi:mitotic interactor and substrate of PLK1 isoform X1 [Electrophorus electricus]|uniref:mitotic interactor and substrate of PLK1 isoform X1 n=1 Tax=Electrophorus electricus TaxID=8005 RepID=UPI0015CFA75C|nr:mitotic interactor and substrate of PLK1 isoform X1 [Electrophorus electricus]
MGSTPKRWVMKPLTPKLEKSDLRPMLSPASEPYSLDEGWIPSQDGGSPVFKFDAVSVSRIQPMIVSTMNGEDMVVHAMQVLVSEEGNTSGDWPPSYPSSPGSSNSSDTHMGFYSFVDDPTSPEAEKNEAYMVSPERQAKLSTLKEKNSFKLQTYAEDKRPEKLFQDTNGDSLYRLDDSMAESNGNNKSDRIEIIRSQAPRKNQVLKEQWSALENLDLSNSPRRLLEGFSLCYNSVSMKLSESEAEPGSVDSQQIDFNSARKQFLMLERSRQDPFQQGPQQMLLSPKPWGRSSVTEAGIFAKEVSINSKLKDEYNQNLVSSKRQEEEPVTFNKDSSDQVQSSSTDDLVTELNSQSVSNRRNGSFSSEPSKLEIRRSSSGTCMSETPIEREIRIAQEREEDLRRSRGILRSDSSEMIEIKTKPILAQPLPQIKPIKAKETSRVSFLIQRELERVNLSENRKTFVSESDQEPTLSLRTNPTGTPVSVDDTWTTERSVRVDQMNLLDSEETFSPCCPHRHKDETKRGTSHTSAVGTLDRTVRTSYTTDINNSSPPFWKAKSKAKVPGRTFSPVHSPSFPPESVRRSQAESARSHLESTNEWPCLLNASDIIRREIEEDLRREQELQELRESSSLALSVDRDVDTSEPSVLSLVTLEHEHGQSSNNRSLDTAVITSLNSSQENLTEMDAPLPDRHGTSNSPVFPMNVDSTPVSHTSLAGSRFPTIMTAQPWSSPRSTAAVIRGLSLLPVGQRPEGSSTLTPKGLTETLLEDFEERRTRLKLEESSYAGIQPIDSINNAVVDATRVTRHKSPKAVRWESRVYTNEDS